MRGVVVYFSAILFFNKRFPYLFEVRLWLGAVCDKTSVLSRASALVNGT